MTFVAFALATLPLKLELQLHFRSILQHPLGLRYAVEYLIFTANPLEAMLSQATGCQFDNCFAN